MSKTHNKSNTKIYRVWNGIKQRCNNPNDGFYYCYGLKGIKICEEWSGNFSCFYDWSIKNGYKEGLTIDRIKNNGNYEPNNCRWATNKEQGNNKRTNKMIEYRGEIKTLSEWCDKLGLEYFRTKARFNTCHMTSEQAFNLPKQILRRKVNKTK